MKTNIIINEGIFTPIELGAKITSKTNIFTNNICEYNTCTTKSNVFVIDLSGYEKIEFLEHSRKIGSSNPKEFIEKNGD